MDEKKALYVNNIFFSFRKCILDSVMAIAISISLSFQRLSKLNQYVCDLIHNTDLNDGL